MEGESSGGKLVKPLKLSLGLLLPTPSRPSILSPQNDFLFGGDLAPGERGRHYEIRGNAAWAPNDGRSGPTMRERIKLSFSITPQRRGRGRNGGACGIVHEVGTMASLVLRPIEASEFRYHFFLR